MTSLARPSRHRVLMEVARAFASRGTCLRARVGTCIARDGRVLVTGYNGPPAGLSHCDPVCQAAHIEGCSVAVHAEANAIAFSARHGISVEGAHLYTTHLPCLGCSQLIVNAGIRQVTYQNDYRLRGGLYLLRQAGVDIIALDERIAIDEEARPELHVED